MAKTHFSTHFKPHSQRLLCTGLHSKKPRKICERLAGVRSAFCSSCLPIHQTSGDAENKIKYIPSYDQTPASRRSAFLPLACRPVSSCGWAGHHPKPRLTIKQKNTRCGHHHTAAPLVLWRAVRGPRSHGRDAPPRCLNLTPMRAPFYRHSFDELNKALPGVASQAEGGIKKKGRRDPITLTDTLEYECHPHSATACPLSHVNEP